MRWTVAVLALTATQALADGEFAAGSKAQSWGLLGEEMARFEAKVTDVLCALTGDCPADCGAGKRQMGVLRSADGKFLIAAKNAQAAFTGATVDLAPYCGMTVTVDGLMVGDTDVTPALGGAKVFQVQSVEVAGGAPAPAETWTGDWATRHPDAAGKGPWFRRDPAVNAEIEAHGRLGLGAEADAQFVKDNF